MADSLNEKSYFIKIRLIFKLRRNNWHGAFLQNIKSESRKNKKKCFHRSSTLSKCQMILDILLRISLAAILAFFDTYKFIDKI